MRRACGGWKNAALRGVQIICDLGKRFAGVFGLGQKFEDQNDALGWAVLAVVVFRYGVVHGWPPAFVYMNCSEFLQTYSIPWRAEKQYLLLNVRFWIRKWKKHENTMRLKENSTWTAVVAHEARNAGSPENKEIGGQTDGNRQTRLRSQIRTVRAKHRKHAIAGLELKCDKKRIFTLDVAFLLQK